MRNLASTVVVVWLLFVASGQPAGADWLVDDDGSQSARAVSIPTGSTPSASAVDDNVTVTWSAVTLPGGGPVQGYLVTRYSGATPVAPNSSCNGIVTSTSCVEADVAAGTWSYRIRPVQGSWVGLEGSASNSVTTTTPDTTPPEVSLGALIKSSGGDGNVIRQGGTYYVYANANDVGSPQSGISTVRANVSSITTGSTAVTLVGGSYTVNGVTYNHRSALLTASNPVSAGSKTISFTATDQAGNNASLNGHVVVVDNTVPAAVDIQTINGGVLGKADSGDRVVYTFSEPIDANSILPGWTGSSANVTVRIANNTGGDRIQVWNPANTTQSSLGFVRLSSVNYVTATVSFINSTIVRSGNTITVTLGTTTGTTATVTAAGAMRWTPNAAGVDWGGNPMPTTALTEPGASDIDL